MSKFIYKDEEIGGVGDVKDAENILCTDPSGEESNVQRELDTLNSNLNDLIIVKSFTSATITIAANSTGNVTIPFTIPIGYKYLTVVWATAINGGARMPIVQSYGENNNNSVSLVAYALGSQQASSIRVDIAFIKE